VKAKARPDRHLSELLMSLFLVVATLAVFWQVQSHEFVNYDDNVYITENRNVQGGLTQKTLVWAFTTTYASNWHPLTWLSHMLDCELFGLTPRGHHLINLLFHVASTLLLFLVLARMTNLVGRSAFVAALFALHPLHVESVAWVAERKDVLSTFFWILTMWAYVRYTEHPGFRRYLLVFLLFALGLICKPMLVTLPFTLLLLDYWPLRRIELGKPTESNALQTQKSTSFGHQRSVGFGLIWEKVPFFFLAGVSSLVSLLAQHQGGAVASLELLPLKIRIANAFVSYATYLWKMIWPLHLAVFYPHPSMVGIWKLFGAGLFVVSLSVLVIRLARKCPYLPVGWFWYLGTLVPVIGVIQVGAQAMADRYTYVPLIGVFIILAWGVPDLLARWRYRRIALAISLGLILPVLMARAWLQVQHWQNTMTLFAHALEVTDHNYLAHTHVGGVLVSRGDLDRGIVHYTKALRIKPNYSLAHYNLGIALDRKGKLDEAIAHYSDALRAKPDYSKAHSNLGVALARQGNLDEAINHFRKALQIEPDLAEVHYNLGRALALKGRLHEAIVHYSEVVRIMPDLSQGHYNLGIALVQEGKLSEGIKHLETAVRLEPDRKPYRRALDALRRQILEPDRAPKNPRRSRLSLH
jgi:Flp pilus assembly protein TadD